MGSARPRLLRSSSLHPGSTPQVLRLPSACRLASTARLPAESQMLRLLSIGVLSTTLAVVPLSAQSKAGGQSAHVRHVLVRGTGDAMEVEIQTSGAPASPDTQALTGPDRIVID